MKYAAIISVLISFAISAILCPILIPFLRKLKFGQTIRDEGPKAHMKKSGTPTMGGLAILISVAVTSLFFVKDYPGSFRSCSPRWDSGSSDSWMISSRWS